MCGLQFTKLIKKGSDELVKLHDNSGAPDDAKLQNNLGPVCPSSQLKNLQDY